MNELQIDTREVEAEKSAIVTRANGLSIVTDADYQGAGEFLRSIKTASKRVDETFDPGISAAHKAHKVAVETKRQFSDPLNAAERVVKGKMGSWYAEQEAARKKEEARLREIAYRDAEDKRLAEAAKLEAAGRKEEAMATLDAPIVAAPVVLAPVTQQAKGVAMRATWKWEVVDMGSIPRDYLTTDDAMIGGVVRAMRGETNIPGIRAFEESSLSARAF